MALCAAAQPAAAITIAVDYTYDLPANGGTNFFGNGNPQGAPRVLRRRPRSMLLPISTARFSPTRSMRL